MAGLNLGQSSQDVLTDSDALSLLDPTTPVEAAFELSYEQTPIGALKRIYNQREEESKGGEKLPAGTLNEMFPTLPEKFNEPTTLRVAQMISDRHDERRRLQQAIENGPKDLLNGVSTFGASLLPHVIDPLNIAASFATGGLVNYFTGARALSTAARLGLSIGENVVGNMAVEPIVFAANRMDNNPYTVSDAFANSIAPAVAFPLVGYAGKKLLRAAGLMDPSTGGAMHTASIGRMAEGKDPKIAPQLLAKQLVRETSGTEFKPYVFRDIDPSNVSDRSFYSARVDGQSALIGDYVGDSIYLSDNGNVANGSAARIGHRSPGEVIEYSLEGLKIANLNEGLPPEVDALVKSLVGKDYNSKTEVLDAITRVADDGNEKLYSDFQQGLRDLGFDGVSYKQDQQFGEAHPPHNVVAVFNKEKLLEKGKQKADPSLVPRLSREEIEQSAQKRLSEDLTDEAFVSDPQAVKDAMKFVDAADTAEPTLAKLKTETQEILADLKEMEKLEALDADDLKQLEEINRLMQRQERIPVATAQALACIRGG